MRKDRPERRVGRLRLSALPLAGVAVFALSVSACGSSPSASTAQSFQTTTSTTAAVSSSSIPASGTAYVTDQYGTIIPISLAGGTVGHPIGPGGGDFASMVPSAIAITPVGGTAYEVTGATGIVAEIDLSSDTTVSEIDLSGINAATAIAITPSGSKAYVATTPAGTVVTITLATGTLGKGITLNVLGSHGGVGITPTAMALTPHGNIAYVVSNYGIFPVNLSTGVTGKPVDAGGLSTATGIAITPEGRSAYITTGATVIPIKLATGTVGGAIELPAGDTAKGIAITPGGSAAYVVTADAVIPIELPSGIVGSPIDLADANGGSTAIAITQ